MLLLGDRPKRMDDAEAQLSWPRSEEVSFVGVLGRNIGGSGDCELNSAPRDEGTRPFESGSMARPPPKE